MNREPGQRSRARDGWRWCSLLPWIGAVPGCVVMAKRRRLRWAIGAGAVTALWFALTAVLGATSSNAAGSNAAGSNAADTVVGVAVLVLYAVQVILLFCAPATKPVGGATPRRAAWLWLSVIPLLGSWLPALAGLRARVWWWVVLGLGCEAVAIATTVQLARSNDPNTAYTDKLGALWWGAWLGGVLVSMLIRPEYQRRVLGTVIERNWPTPTDRARALTWRYALGAYVCALALIAAIVAAEKTSKNMVLWGVAAILGEILTIALLVPLVRSRRLRPRDLGLRRTIPTPAAGYAVLALIGYAVAICIWIVLLPQTTNQAAHKLTAVTHHPGPLAAVLIVLGLAVFAPLCEEVFFRGMLYRSLRNRLSLWPAVLIAGSLFGLIHIFAYPLNTIPIKIVFGILMCLLYERTGSLLPGIAVHSFVDGTAADVAVTGNAYAALVVYGLLLVLVLVLALRTGRTRPIANGLPLSESLPLPYYRIAAPSQQTQWDKT
jgi:membrane protease YdiL (CAAX protease family)